ncbi:MAG TPA: SCO family protein [Steroidobacteraceae bacterium]
MSQRDNHESYEVFARQLHWIAAIIVGTLVAVVWLMYGLSKTWLGPLPEAPRGAAMPAPRLQPSPHADLVAHRAHERDLLEHYQWIDRDAGIARIPIERAMQLLAGSSQRAAAVPPAPPASSPRPAGPAPPKDLYQRAGLQQRLGSRVPQHLMFRDSSGRNLTLQQVIHGKPTLLALGYYRCPNLCDLTLRGMGRAVGAIPLQLGGDYEVAFVSIDPHESPREARATAAMLRQDEPAAHAEHWYFLTGGESAIRSLAEAIGFQYFYDARIGQYAHAAGLVVLTGQGQVAQYFFGVSFPPKALRLALVNASSGRLGTVLDQLVLLCCGYDPSTGRYSLLIGRLTQVIGIAFLLAALGTWWTLHRRTRR